MILKSLSLKNFRQFINDEIAFSTDAEKNVTLIRGKNTSGKTTIASAFRWCMFGEKNMEGSILNKTVAHDMYEGDTVSAEVTIRLEKDKTEYAITRRQEFVKDGNGISEGRYDIQIESTDKEDGISREPHADRASKEDMIRNIIPEYLSKYLFVTGEQINNLEEWIKTNKSDKDLHSAVKTILAITPALNAITHLETTNKKFREQLKPSDEAQAATLKKEIEFLTKKIESNKEKIQECIQDIDNLEDSNEDLHEKLQHAVDDTEILETIDRLKKDVDGIKKDITDERTKFLASFSKMLPNYCITRLAHSVIEMLGKRDGNDRYLPGISEATIRMLLKRKYCLCGNRLEEGSDGCSRLNALLESLPPLSIEPEIYYFNENLQSKLNDLRLYDLKTTYDEFRGFIAEKEKTLMLKQKEIDRKEEIIKKEGSLRASGILEEIKENTESIVQQQKLKLTLESDVEKAEKESEEKKNMFRRITSSGNENAQINLCIDYADHIRKTITEVLNTREKEYLDKINHKVNEIFLSVFKKNYNINIDAKYKISVTDIYTNETIGLSGSESIFVVLSFISAILYVANANEDEYLKTEPYPLVLDAPLSNFDPQNMIQASKKFPELSKQVIIISKEPEMECISTQISDSVGRFYELAIEEKDGKDTLIASISEQEDFYYG